MEKAVKGDGVRLFRPMPKYRQSRSFPFMDNQGDIMIAETNAEAANILLGYGDALIGLFGVFVGGVIVVLREWWGEKTQRQRDCSYSAIRLICILEEYAHKCVGVARDDGYFLGRPSHRNENGEEVCRPQTNTPIPLDYPDDTTWRSLDEVLMHRVLALPNMARSTDRYVSESAENALPPDYEEFFEPRQEGYAKLGLEALRLVDDLRNRYGVEARSHSELGEERDPKEKLQNLLKQFADRDAKREKGG